MTLFSRSVPSRALSVRPWVACTLAGAVLLAGCADASDPDADAPATAGSSQAPESTPEPAETESAVPTPEPVVATGPRVTSEDGRVAMNLPAGWSAEPTHDFGDTLTAYGKPGDPVQTIDVSIPKFPVGPSEALADAKSTTGVKTVEVTTSGLRMADRDTFVLESAEARPTELFVVVGVAGDPAATVTFMNHMASTDPGERRDQLTALRELALQVIPTVEISGS